MKPKVKLIGNSFHPNTSSCSTRIPVNFSWSNDEGDVEVYVDNAILQGASTPNHLRKFGWICESRAVAWQLTEQLKQNHEEILKNYQYIFTCDEELLSLNPKFVFGFAGSTLPWVKLMEYNIYNKTKLCSMIASAKQMSPGHLLRHQVAQKMLDAGVHVVGGACGTPKIGLDSGRIQQSSTENEYKTVKGSAIVFPSNFMFPHAVKKVEKGTRYSIVTWLM